MFEFYHMCNVLQAGNGLHVQTWIKTAHFHYFWGEMLERLLFRQRNTWPVKWLHGSVGTVSSPQSKSSNPHKTIKGSLIFCETRATRLSMSFTFGARDQIGVYELDTCLLLTVCKCFNRLNEEKVGERESGLYRGKKYSWHSEWPSCELQPPPAAVFLWFVKLIWLLTISLKCDVWLR